MEKGNSPPFKRGSRLRLEKACNEFEGPTGKGTAWESGGHTPFGEKKKPQSPRDRNKKKKLRGEEARTFGGKSGRRDRQCSDLSRAVLEQQRERGPENLTCRTNGLETTSPCQRKLSRTKAPGGEKGNKKEGRTKKFFQRVLESQGRGSEDHKITQTKKPGRGAVLDRRRKTASKNMEKWEKLYSKKGKSSVSLSESHPDLRTRTV